MTKVIGLTGGIASGKSTVSHYLASLDIPIIDADQVARQVMRAGSPIVDTISKRFGKEVLFENGEINRKYLGQLVFSDPEKRKQLNQLVQGTIRKEIDRQKRKLLKEKPPLIILDVPLLYEEHYETEVDEVLVVFVHTQTQIERLLKRNPDLTKKEALHRIQAQIPLKEKAKRADILIDNNGTIEQTLDQVKKWLKKACPHFEVQA